MNIPRRHHFVPEFCLAHFAGKDGRVWTYDVEAEVPRPSLPRETGFERDFHTLTKNNGERDTILESILARVESDAAPIYVDMTKGKLPKGDARTNIAHFLGAMYVRSKRIRRTYGEGYGQLMQVIAQRMSESEKGFSEMLTNFENQNGVQFSADRHDQIRRDMADWSGYSVSMDREFTLGTFNMFGTITTLINQMHWSLLEANDEIYLLSDSPLIESGALEKPQTQISLPLSPRMLWIGHWRTDLPVRSSLSRQNVRAFNRMRAAGADRFLYAPYEDAVLMRFCKKHVGPRPGFKVGDGDASKLAPTIVRRKQ